VDAAPVFGT
jgi:hypothetical protein